QEKEKKKRCRESILPIIISCYQLLTPFRPRRYLWGRGRTKKVPPARTGNPRRREVNDRARANQKAGFPQPRQASLNPGGRLPDFVNGAGTANLSYLSPHLV